MVKNLLIIDHTGRIHCLSMTYEGKWQDKGIADTETYRLPAGSTLYQDKGFQGFVADDVIIVQPKKKPRGGELTAAEKEENSRINKIRVLIENAIGSVKRCRIVKDKFRLWREHIHDMIMETCCGLHNFRLKYRPLRRNADN